MINLKDYKQSILIKAMRGQLTKQLANDGDAQDLANNIENHRKYLVKTKQIQNHKPKSISNKHPYKLPKNWCWTNLDHLVLIVCGRDLPKYKQTNVNDSDTIPYITGASNFINNKITTRTYLNLKYASVIGHKHDLLITVKGTVGDLAFLPYKEAHLARQIMGIRFIGGVEPEFIKLYLQLYKYKLLDKSKGMIPGIKKNDLQSLLIPLPPLAEQRRIINKVNVCFKLPKLIQKKRNLTKMFKHDLKASLIRLAMHGKLTKQLFSDGTGEDLINKIKQHIKYLVDNKKIRKPEKLKPISEVPYKIPKNWVWTKLGMLTEVNLGCTPSKHDKSYWNNGTIPWVSVSDLNNGIVSHTIRHITKKASYEAFKNRPIAPKGTLLMSFKLTIGKMGVLDKPMYHNEAIASFPFYCNGNILKPYMYYILPTLCHYVRVTPAVKGKTLNKTKLNNMLVPLPPLPEQQRIVKVLKHLFSELRFK